jgi:alpha,alpha-trehalase
MQTKLWDETSGTFRDYNWRTGQLSSEDTVAMAVPLFSGVATPAQAKRVAKALKTSFLKPGGLVTTTIASGQQWDAPNGWAPHQWMAYAGLKRYHQDWLADTIRTRWLRLNKSVYAKTGKLMEKYNVIDLSKRSGGGEYPSQDGFGWTNGVFRALQEKTALLNHVDRDVFQR